ncbi:hypothetical protein C4566_02160 [Candidatus Parcubacteria bacterium]|nr:MAG: hypothetical protein C4566_02160 [Candidatus Parcubacteria bacterium]
MKLYHGSKNSSLQLIKKQQAQAGEGVEVPADELLEGIYLTPDYGYALAMAARPDGLTHINTENKTIAFENPEAFDTQMPVYIYEVDVPDDQARQIDQLQWVIENMKEIVPTQVFNHQAGDVTQYYEVLKEKRETENKVPEFKIK